MSLNALPAPRIIVSELLSGLQRSRSSSSGIDSSNSNPLKNADDETKKILLTFHVLYPNDFLPALDLLDRRLLTRLTIRSAEPQSSGADPQPSAAAQPAPRATPLYIVRSAQQPRSTTASRSYDALAAHYEVRPTAWNCSCAAFAFAAFPAAPAPPPSLPPRTDAAMLRFGGLSAGAALPPACKHLLACVLAEHVEALRRFADERECSVEEVAGWCAGWGD